MKTITMTFKVPNNFEPDTIDCYSICPFGKHEESRMVWCSDDEEYRIREGYDDCVFDCDCIFKSKKVKVSSSGITTNKEKKKKSTNVKEKKKNSTDSKDLFGEDIFDDGDDDEEVIVTENTFKSAFEAYQQAIDTTKEYKGE